MADFISLSPEIKSLIFGYLTLPEDWINACTVCKDFYNHTIVVAYHTIDISEDLDISKLSQLLNPNNTGLEKVRRIRLRCAAPFRPKHDRNRDRILNMLIDQLPRDILLSFRIDTQRVVDQTIVDALHDRQRHLQTLRCEANVIRPALEGLDLSKLSAVQLFVRNDKGLETVRSILVAAYNMKSLEIFVDWDEYLDIIYPDGPNRRKASDDLIGALLGEAQDEESLHDSSSVISRALSTLRIRGVDLSLAGKRIYEAIRPSALRSLSLEHCENETSLLRLMSTPPTDGGRALHVRHLEIVHSKTRMRSPGEEDDSISGFLACFDTLETLIVSAPDHHTVMASASSISNHHNLRTLYLEYGAGINVRWYPAKDMFDCFGKCKKIEQLALNLPEMEILLKYGTNRIQFQEYLIALAGLPNLRTLRVLDLPTAETLDWEIMDAEVAVTHARHMLRDVAIAIFEEIAFEGATVLSFGREHFTIDRWGRRRRRRNRDSDEDSDGNDDDDDDDDDDDSLLALEDDTFDQKTYLQGTRTGPRDDQIYLDVVEVKVAEAREEEPISSILDIDVHDTNMAFVGYAVE